eukprot:5580396-Amphidinium_carterae.1
MPEPQQQLWRQRAEKGKTYPADCREASQGVDAEADDAAVCDTYINVVVPSKGSGLGLRNDRSETGASASAEAIGRWRLPLLKISSLPIYEEACLIKEQDGSLQPPSSTERKKMLGCPRDHTYPVSSLAVERENC